MLSTIPVPAGPHGVVITPDGRWVYVSSDGASTVSVIDLGTQTVTAAIPIGKASRKIAIQPTASVTAAGAIAR